LLDFAFSIPLCLPFPFVSAFSSTSQGLFFPSGSSVVLVPVTVKADVNTGPVVFIGISVKSRIVPDTVKDEVKTEDVSMMGITTSEKLTPVTVKDDVNTGSVVEDPINVLGIII